MICTFFMQKKIENSKLSLLICCSLILWRINKLWVFLITFFCSSNFLATKILIHKKNYPKNKNSNLIFASLLIPHNTNFSSFIPRFFARQNFSWSPKILVTKILLTPHFKKKTPKNNF
jgi:hypothetical protein